MFLVCFSLLSVTNTYLSAQNLITIPQARLAALGTLVKVRGMITVTPTADNRNRQRSMQDGKCDNCGMTIFSTTGAATTLQSLTVGDSVEVSGEMGVFGESLQIISTTANPMNITIISRGNPIPTPILITPAFAITPAAEKYEGMLVRMEDVSLAINSSSVFSSGTVGATYFMNDGVVPLTFTTFLLPTNSRLQATLPGLRINPGNSMNGQTIPSGLFSINGIFGQSKVSGTVGEGYQITPNGFSDFEVGFALSNFRQTAVTSTSLDIAWNTNIDAKNTIKIGLAPVDIANTVYTSTIIQDNSTRNGSIVFSSLLPATLYTVEIKSQTATGKTIIVRDVFVTASESTGEIKVFFNSTTASATLPTTAVPVGNPATCGGTSLVAPQNLSTGFNNLPNTDEVIASYIDKALFSIEIAVYNSNTAGSPKIIAALNAAGARGVQVRYIYDSSNANTALSALPTTVNIKKMADRATATRVNDAIMHNKFIVIDAGTKLNSWVVTGSGNHTDNSLNKNLALLPPTVPVAIPNGATDPNNFLFIQDQSLARAYTQEFNEMWGTGPDASNLPQSASKFGPNKTKNTPTSFVINQKAVDLHFSPTDAVSNNIRKNLYTTNNDLRFSLLILTDANLANAIDSLQNTGIRTGSAIDVKGIVDDENVTNQFGGLVPSLRARGVNVQTYTNANKIFHHKYAVVDAKRNDSDPIVITGSHNWTGKADTDNDENTLVIHDGAIAREYLAEFGSRWFETTGLCDAYLTAIDNNANAGASTKTESVIAYPNPNNGKFSIRFEEMVGKMATITLKNLNGQILLSSKTTGEAITELDAQNLATGMYLLEIELNGVRTIKKIIVNK